ncbi:MAG: ribonuclease H-like domain-containing protein [bacterium]
MLYYHTKKIIVFDIETTGLSAPEDEFICASTYIPYEDSYDELKVQKSLTDLWKFYNKLEKDKYLIATYNGDYNYYGGFDFRFLRTKFALNKLGWCFKNFEHLDIFPLIKKFINNKYVKQEPESISNLYKNDIQKLATINNLEYSTKKETYKSIQSLDNPEWLDYIKEKQIDKYDEQSVYQTFFDPKKEEEYIDGSEVPKLYKEGKLDKIVRHNCNDVKRLYKLINLLLDYFPSYQVNREIKKI